MGIKVLGKVTQFGRTKLWEGLQGVLLNKIFSGYGQTFRILDDEGVLHGFGENSFGQLGMTNNTTQTTLVSSTTSPINIIEAGISANSTMVITGGTELWCSGREENGQFGSNVTIGRNVTTFLHSKKVGNTTITDAVAAATYGNTCLYLNDSGQVYVAGWPIGLYGLVGGLAEKPLFEAIPSLNNVTKIAINANLGTYYVRTDGELYVAGNTGSGELGASSAASNTTATLVPGMSGISRIDGEQLGNTMILKNDNTLWMAGKNDQGQFGTGATGANVTTFTQVLDETVAMANLVNAGAINALKFAVRTNGDVYYTGNDSNSIFGGGNILSWTKLTSISGVIDIVGGYNHIFMFKSDGTVHFLGLPQTGWSGLIGTSTLVTTPTEVPALSAFVTIA